MSVIGVRCHICGEIHILNRDEGYKGYNKGRGGGWRVKYTYTCPIMKREYKVYTQGVLLVLAKTNGEKVNG